MIHLDIRSLTQDAAIKNVEMEVIEILPEEEKEKDSSSDEEEEDEDDVEPVRFNGE